MQRNLKNFNVYGDNIVECKRAFSYIISALGNLVESIVGPESSITCPTYLVRLRREDLKFQFLPGYGEQRWNQDILAFIQQSGGRLREAVDAIVTRIEQEAERPIVAIEFCGALPAGNQAWQRQGRAFSFAHAQVPYFFVTELGGFELGASRDRKAERMPNPAIPFSFVSMMQYHASVCLPVYEPNAGASEGMVTRFNSIFGKEKFLEFLKGAVLDSVENNAILSLREKCISFVTILAESKKRKDGLTGSQWRHAHLSINSGKSLPDFLQKNVRLKWKKTAYIDGLTRTAKSFMDLGSEESLGLTSSTLPLSFVPKDSRAKFSSAAEKLYPDMDGNFRVWLADMSRHLAVSWVMGFKPGGDDARPDRGLPPLARMLIGDGCDLMTFVYGPAPQAHWEELAMSPASLTERNGLWEAVLGVSDAVLVDSSTKPSSTPRGYLRDSWDDAISKKKFPLKVRASVLRLGEQDVDTVLHLALTSLGDEIAFEGMCNPPGGDWSGISFRWDKRGPDYRWLTLPRVSAGNAKRPDHVFALFGYGNNPVSLCIESKDQAKSLDKNIGPRLTQYAKALFDGTPSIMKKSSTVSWSTYNGIWKCPQMTYISAGAFRASSADPFCDVPHNTDLDIQIAVQFAPDGETCILHLKGETDSGRALARYLSTLGKWSGLVTVKECS